MDSTATQPPLELTTFNNQSLFSDHYLDEILRRDEAWQAARPAAEAFLAWLRNLYAQEKAQLLHYNEDQLEDKWFKPIFARLGLEHWEGQAAIPGWQGKVKKPDFFFFPDEAARQTAVSQQNTLSYAQSALAVCEVKQWGVNLSRKTGAQPIFADQNPMYQIDTYLTLTELTWGVLSNGRFWRLLHKSSSRTLETYFEVDLLAALEETDETKATAVALYFWLFFNHHAFRPGKDGHTFLAHALTQSRTYALALEEDLRDNAYRALEQLIIGFFAGDNRLNPHDPADRDAVYRGSLYLLYRLLFLFYGESRALLPIHIPLYQQYYSLQQLTRKIDTQRNQLTNLPNTGKRYWNQIQELFRLISGVDPQLNADLGVPRYNGGLFDPAQHPFLEQHFVGDRALALAIDYLATRRIIEAGGKPAYQAVDYRTLDVRQLGSIYEGLLEYRVAVATEEMVTISQKGVETWVPLAQKGKAKSYGERRQPGELYLTTDKGERKATGSYYTPDYIVEYIVANTLGPLVEQIRARANPSPSSSSSSSSSSSLFIEGILALNILDPAMGSGHFLVEATHYLARALATYEHTPSPSSSSSSSSSDLLYWKRRVVEACIYGVDKNPMAVELAKLSLWLKTAVADKPLSFLDHHLQCGDSLVGARLADLVKPPGGVRGAGERGSRGAEEQMALFDEGAFAQDMFRAVGGVMRIERLPTLDIETVHAKEAAWRDIQQTHVARWRQLADLWTSAYFGNEMTPEEYRALADRLQGRESLLSETQAERFLRHPAVRDNDYFHWELAFPEVFYDEYGNRRGEAAGFDAVIGNPPYVRQELFSSSKQFFQIHYKVFHSAADLYIYFMELGINALNRNGLSGFIVSHKFMRADYGLLLRKLLTRLAQLQQIIHFGDLPVFGDISAYPSILLWQKQQQLGKVLPNVLVAQFTDMGFVADLATAVQQSAYQLSPLGLQDTGWTLRNGAITALQQKIVRAGQPLSEYVNGQIHYGIKTGLNQAFFIDRFTRDRLVQSAPKTVELIKPLAVGEDLQRYALFDQGQFIIVIPAGWTKAQSGLVDEWAAWKWLQEAYAPLAEHLSPFAEQARKRRDMGDFWWELRPCAYYAAFESPKIIYPVIAKDLRFSLDYAGFYGNDKTYIIPQEDYYLLALLNATLTAFFARFALSGLRGDYLEFRASHFQNLPIFPVSFATSPDARTAVLTTFQTHYAQADYPAILSLAASELASGRNDTIHDLLAFLAEQMIALNKEKQSALETFWLDLEGVADGKTFAALRGKGKQQASLHKAIPAARPFISESSRSAVTLNASLEWNEDAFKGFVKELAGSVSGLSKLVQVYRDQATAVATLAQRLQATDRLIDQIVYQLYGLTPEEIAIVEG